MKHGSQMPGAGWRIAIALALAEPLTAATLSERIDEALQSAPAARSAFWGIAVVDLASGKTLYERNANQWFVPASNTKLFTTALALARLGADFRFQTRVMAAVPPDAEGRIGGSLVLEGGGDPNLSARAVPYRKGPTSGDPLAAIKELADQIAARGVTRVDGDIVGDDTWYVWQPYGEGWAIDDLQFDYGAPVSALTINDNAFTLSVRPGAREDDPAALTLEPPLEYYRIDNRVRTTSATAAWQIQFRRAPGSRELLLWGEMPLGDRGQDLWLAIDDPARYAAMALREALEDRGVVVAGGAVARHEFPDAAPDLKSAPSRATVTGVELARRESAPLIEDLRITDKVSQNLHAELALRAVARARRNIGSREAAIEELKGFLGEIGISPETVHLNDGSGLTRVNLVTPAAVVRLLRHMYAQPTREQWISLLPVGGEDGTLSTRFGENGIAGRVHAKTGSLAHISALSGYLERRNGGERVAFSILVNNFNGPAAEVRGVMDRICHLIWE